MPDISGFDMKPTIEWYEANKREFLAKLPEASGGPLTYPVLSPENVHLSSPEMSGIVYHFPAAALRRSLLKKIVGQPPTWFHRDSTAKKPVPTTNAGEALSPTAIIPSYTDNSEWIKTGQPASDIWLYKIEDGACSPEAKKIITTEGLIHELGHTIISPALYVGGYQLRLPNGKVVSGADFMLEFAAAAEKHPPISHYASAYRGKAGKFESDDPGYNAKIAISEELCESIAADVLGFAYCGDDRRGKDPFADRPNIRKFTEDFLNAEIVQA